MPDSIFSQACKVDAAQEIKTYPALTGTSGFNCAPRRKIFTDTLKNIPSQLPGFSSIGRRLRPWPGIVIRTSLAAGMLVLGPDQALAQNNVINGTTNADQCGHVYSCPRVSGDVSDGTLTIINSGEMIGGAQAYGGYTLEGRAYDNAFIMNGGYLRGGHGYGGYTGNGTAEGNRVTISDTGGDGYGGRVEITIVSGQPSGGNLYGGYSESGGDALNNTVTINNGNIYGSIIGGRVLSGQASGNEVMVSADGLVQTAVYGGWVEDTGLAANNKVTVSGLAYSGAYGAYVNIGDALQNQVIISGGQVTNGWVYGGRVETQGNAIGNRVTIQAGSVIGRQIYGGYVASGEASQNVVTFEDGWASGELYGGFSGSGDAQSNQVTINGGSVTNQVYGGRVTDGAAEHNRVAVSGGSVTNEIYGGWAQNGSASYNTVTIDLAALVSSAVTGGYVIGSASPGRADGNTVAIEHSGSLTGDIIGGWVQSIGSVGNSASGNVVTAIGGLVNGAIYGGWLVAGDGNAHQNQVTLQNITAQLSVYGGRVDEGSAERNQVNITGSSTIYGDIYGGWANDGSASSNIVTIIDGTVQGYVSGGRAKGAAFDNKVTIHSGSVDNEVYGGYSVLDAATGNLVAVYGGSLDKDVYGGYSEQSVATGNTVALSGGAIGGSVYGGWSLDSSMDVRTGNRLSVNGFQGSLVRLDNFELYDFYIPSAMQNNDTLITITGSVATDLTGSKVDSLIIDPTSSLAAGQQVTLIDQVSGNFDTARFITPKSALVLHQVSVLKEGDRLLARLDGTRANPQSKALAQGALAGMVLLNQGADLAFSQGLDRALNGIMTTESGRPAFFTATSAANSRVETGSHLDLDGWSFLAGLAWKADHTDRKGWLAGAYFETGRGSYDGYNTFAEYSRIRSSGDTKYYGGGLMARYQWASGFRAEAGLRAGRVETDYQGSGYLGDTQAEFDLGTAYYGAHLGLGQEISLSEKLTLDLSARYIWTHEDGQKTRVLGDRLEFKDIDSHRVRAGGQLTYEAHPMVAPYAGAWVEQEFDGRAGSRNLSAQLSHDSLKTRGTTGGGELGVKINPGMSDQFSLDLGLEGYTGRREGVSGHISLTVTF